MVACKRCYTIVRVAFHGSVAQTDKSRCLRLVVNKWQCQKLPIGGDAPVFRSHLAAGARTITTSEVKTA